MTVPTVPPPPRAPAGEARAGPLRAPVEAGGAIILAGAVLLAMDGASHHVLGNWAASVGVVRWEGELGEPLDVRDENSPGAEIAEEAAP